MAAEQSAGERSAGLMNARASDRAMDGSIDRWARERRRGREDGRSGRAQIAALTVVVVGAGAGAGAEFRYEDGDWSDWRGGRGGEAEAEDEDEEQVIKAGEQTMMVGRRRMECTCRGQELAVASSPVR
ncbi:hypothetical protein MPTK2_7g08550 [Marchantia polymorpha subsp. ruderalis]